MGGIDVLILCCGSRGDTEPWARLAAGLRRRGRSAALAAHPEYEGLVHEIVAESEASGAAEDGGGTAIGLGPPVAFRPIRGSLPLALTDSAEGRAMRDAKGFRAAMAAGLALFAPLAALWLDDALAAARELRPRVLVVTTMHYITGAWLIPEILRRERAAAAAAFDGAAAGGGDSGSKEEEKEEEEMRLLIAHTVITHKTSAYAPPTASAGPELPFGWLRRLVWTLGVKVADRHLYAPILAAAVARHAVLRDGAPLPFPGWYEFDEATKPPTIYVISPALLPRAPDWPPSVEMVGPLLPPGARGSALEAAPPEAAEAAEALPADLRAWIAAAKRAGLPIVYIGLGSMLGAFYDDPPAVVRALAAGAARAQARGARFAAILHTVTGANGEAVAVGDAAADGGAGASADAGGAAAPFFLSRPVPHAALLPLIDLAVHHGGCGTTQAAAAAGRPALIVPVGLASDQPFWAKRMARTRTCLASAKPVGELAPEAFAALLARAVAALPKLAPAARELAAQMRAEPDGVEAAVAVVERSLPLAAAVAAADP